MLTFNGRGPCRLRPKSAEIDTNQYGKLRVNCCTCGAIFVANDTGHWLHLSSVRQDDPSLAARLKNALVEAEQAPRPA